MKKIFLILGALLLTTAMLFSQTEVIMNGTQSSVTGCNFKIYDGGGNDGNYLPNTNTALTIISNNATNRSVEIEITFLEIDVSDTLFIYDGANTTAPLLKWFNASNYTPAGTYIYTASIGNPTGAITLHLKSDTTYETAGFIVETRCVKPCQRVFIEFDENNSTHIPALDPRRPNDDYSYINVCPDDSVVLCAYGVYPDNGYAYQQSDAQTMFTFDYGDTVVSGLGLTCHSYKFIPERGYSVSISAQDQDGCVSMIPVSFRVRTSRNPIIGMLKFPDVCTGQEMKFRFGADGGAHFQTDSVGSEQLSTLSVSDTIFLPDGENCQPYGLSYRSPVTFTAFSPNAVITAAGDILYVRLNIEHSYIGDILIQLVCPTGQSTILLPDYMTYHYTGTTYAYFGDMYEPDGGGCNEASNIQGVGWNYVWSQNTDPARGYVYAAGNSYVYESVNIGNHLSGTVDSSNTVAKTQFYKPYQSFNNMIGCPLNGQWYIEVKDTWRSDNGYVFGWEMALDEKLLPQNWSYSVNIDSMYIVGPGGVETSVTPTIAGAIDYLAVVVDEYGCVYDTAFVLNVVSSPMPDLGENVELCAGEMLNLNANFDDSTAVYQWNTGAKEDNIHVVSQGEYIVRVTTYNEDSSLVCVGYDTVNVKYSATPRADFEASSTSDCSPLRFLLYDRSEPEDMEKTYVWRIYDESNRLVYESELPEPEITLETPGKYHVEHKITTLAGCTDETIKYDYLEVFPQPYAEFQANPEVSILSETGGEVQFTNYTDSTVAYMDGVSWSWDFGDGSSDNASLSLPHTYSSWGDYVVTFHISSSQGCSDQISHLVIIEEDLTFPNVITPNGDNINDVFAVGNLNTSINPEDPDRFRHNELYVYDRWGKKVYTASDYDTYSKDGEIIPGSQYFNGSGLPDGVYYFTFYFKGKAKTIDYHGTLTILRGEGK
ncbi:MAG: gliding motility-associated C-terminal domain-containing protein [Bacteroidales bacterium]|jgi:gliding motility-associated-like protein|nr:gliding motility-associated C-terminal domain-containing protein [Bacteroidales bacterium]